ncbi:MAG TPA: hypothetical protein VL027_08180 [Spongiibacteraceae bacterium]|nr:hypothetical protein [Spongiibacteraceae bacterium]
MMKNMMIKLLVLGVLAALLVVCVLVYSRGRDSGYFHRVSAVVAPVSEHLLGTGSVLRLPFEWRGGAALNWHWFQPRLVDVRQTAGSLLMVPNRESVWWKNKHGPMLYHDVDGDFSATVALRVRKHSDPAQPPDREWQFGGIILRDPRSAAWLGRENYVFNVVGHRGSRLQVETKSTRLGRSQVDAWNWPDGDAELRIQRRGAHYEMAVRPAAQAPWQVLTDYVRPDLPDQLQLGLIVYAYSEGRGIFDVEIHFDALSVVPLVDEE